MSQVVVVTRPWTSLEDVRGEQPTRWVKHGVVRTQAVPFCRPTRAGFTASCRPAGSGSSRPVLSPGARSRPHRRTSCPAAHPKSRRNLTPYRVGAAVMSEVVGRSRPPLAGLVGTRPCWPRPGAYTGPSPDGPVLPSASGSGIALRPPTRPGLYAHRGLDLRVVTVRLMCPRSGIVGAGRPGTATGVLQRVKDDLLRGSASPGDHRVQVTHGPGCRAGVFGFAAAGTHLQFLFLARGCSGHSFGSSGSKPPAAGGPEPGSGPIRVFLLVCFFWDPPEPERPPTGGVTGETVTAADLHRGVCRAARNPGATGPPMYRLRTRFWCRPWSTQYGPSGNRPNSVWRTAGLIPEQQGSNAGSSTLGTSTTVPPPAARNKPTTRVR